MKRAVLVNGVPASGKSTVARSIAYRFGWPLFSLDAVKEPFFEHIGVGDREYNRKLGRASYAAIFNVIAECPDDISVVIDAWFGFQPAEILVAHLKRAGLDEILEIWCHAAPEEIAARYRRRVEIRAPGHPGLEYVPELIELAARAHPLDLFPRLDVETSNPADDTAIADWIERQWAIIPRVNSQSG